MILRSWHDMSVVGEAGTGHQAIELTLRKHPDIVMTEIQLADISGVEVTRRIVKALPGTKVIAFASLTTGRLVSDMIEAGALGYVSKDASLDELAAAIDHIRAGKRYVDTRAGEALASGYGGRQGNAAHRLSKLTEREHEVLKLITQGLSTKEMADKLSISPRTVDGHRQNIMDKLQIHGVTHLFAYAVREGLLSTA